MKKNLFHLISVGLSLTLLASCNSSNSTSVTTPSSNNSGTVETSPIISNTTNNSTSQKPTSTGSQGGSSTTTTTTTTTTSNDATNDATLTLNVGNNALAVGESTSASVTISEGDASQAVWETSDSGVLSLSSNKGSSITIRAVKAGTASISVTLNGKSASKDFTVSATAIDFSINIDNNSIEVGQSSKAQVVVISGDAKASSATWSSSDPDTVSIAGSGETVTLTALKEGSATITATLEGRSKSQTIQAIAKPTQVLKELKIAHLSDVHVVPRYLVANTADYDDAINSDRKLLTESEAILHANIDRLIKEAPDVLLVSGDLTKDGEGQSHELLARELARFQTEIFKAKGHKPQVVLVPGNHDIRNSNGKNFSGATGAQNDPSQTEGAQYLQPEYNYKATPAVTTDPWYGDGFLYKSKAEANADPEKPREAMGDIYNDVVYSDQNIVGFYKDSEFYKKAQAEVAKKHADDATLNPATVAEANTLSYAVRLTGNHDVKDSNTSNGITLICLDSARYSADNTDTKEDEHETSGQVSEYALEWVESMARQAKARGDSILLTMHHGVVPHFSMEPTLLSMYLVNDYQKVAERFANAGIHYVFTGHMHANDIAEYTSGNGQKLYDVETGSLITYPTSYRMLDVKYTETGDKKRLQIQAEERRLDKQGLADLGEKIMVPSISDPENKVYNNAGDEVAKTDASAGITDLRLYAHALNKGLRSEMARPLMLELRNEINDEYIGKDKKLSDFIDEYAQKYSIIDPTADDQTDPNYKEGSSTNSKQTALNFVEAVIRAFIAGTPENPTYFYGGPSEGEASSTASFNVSFSFGNHAGSPISGPTYRFQAHMEDIPIIGNKDFEVFFTAQNVRSWLYDLVDNELQKKLLNSDTYTTTDDDPLMKFADDAKATLLDKYIAVGSNGEGYTLTNFINRVYLAHLAGDEDSPAASTQIEGQPGPDDDDNTRNGLNPWVKDVVNDFKQGKDSTILYGADGVFQTVAQNMSTYIYDLFGNINLLGDKNNPNSFINQIQPSAGSQNMWAVVKQVLANMTSPFSGTQNIMSDLINNAMVSMVNASQDGSDTANGGKGNLFTQLGVFATEIVTSFTHDDNNEANGISSDLNTTLNTDL